MVNSKPFPNKPSLEEGIAENQSPALGAAAPSAGRNHLICQVNFYGVSCNKVLDISSL